MEDDVESSKKKIRAKYCTTSTAVETDSSKPSHKEIVCALATFVCLEVKENSKGERKEYVVRRCPNKEYCKNEGGLIHYQNKAGYKNPHLHLRTCVAKVSFMNSAKR